MAGVTRYFFDTSVLIAGVVELGSHRDPPQRLMTAVAKSTIRRPRTAWHCCLEFYSVVTRLPEEYRLAPVDAARLVEEELLERFEIHALPADRRLDLVRGAATDGIGGGRVYDLHIAEVARAADAEIVVTENRRHFTQLLRYGLRVLSSAEAAAELAL